MTEPYYDHGGVTIYCGDCRDVPPTLPAESVHCVVTSPPYWGLRAYGGYAMQLLWGTKTDFCLPRKHRERWWLRIRWRAWERGGIFSPNGKTWIGALGLEPTPELYVAHMVEVFREVRRVMRKDGTVFLNMGDAYCSGTSAPRQATTTEGPDVPASWSNRCQAERIASGAGLKPKDLCGIPWRLAFALQADGWWLRQDIIWAKPNPMPESVTDRCTKAHEYVFLLTKAARYFYDADAVRERGASGYGPSTELKGDWTPGDRDPLGRGNCLASNPARSHVEHPGGRNLRSVWTINQELWHLRDDLSDADRLCVLGELLRLGLSTNKDGNNDDRC